MGRASLLGLTHKLRVLYTTVGSWGGRHANGLAWVLPSNLLGAEISTLEEEGKLSSHTTHPPPRLQKQSTTAGVVNFEYPPEGGWLPHLSPYLKLS